MIEIKKDEIKTSWDGSYVEVKSIISLVSSYLISYSALEIGFRID